MSFYKSTQSKSIYTVEQSFKDISIFMQGNWGSFILTHSGHYTHFKRKNDFRKSLDAYDMETLIYILLSYLNVFI